MTGKSIPAILLIALVIGCGQSHPTVVVATPDELTLYAVHGRGPEPTSYVTDAERFRGYRILGKVEIADPTDRLEIMKAVIDGISESKGESAHCFWPRHGIHAVTDGKAIDYVICYECQYVYTFTNDELVAIEKTATTHQAVLTDRLKAAGIELTPKNAK